MQVTVDLSALEGLAGKLEKIADGLPAACSRALNRSGDMTRTAMARELAEQTGLQVGDVKAEIEVVRATPSNLAYELAIRSHPTTLGEYGPHETRQGVSARPWGERRVFPGTFMLRDEVFKRVCPERLPIKELFGPDLSKEARRGDVPMIARATAEQALRARLLHEVGRIAKGSGVSLVDVGDEGDEGLE